MSGIGAARTTTLAAFDAWTDQDDGGAGDFRWHDLTLALARCGLAKEALASAHHLQLPELGAQAGMETRTPRSLAAL